MNAEAGTGLEEAERAVRADAVEFIRCTRLFGSCSPAAIDRIASALELRRAAAGSVVFEEGSSGDEMYIVAEGHLRVVSDAATEKVVFAHLGPGEFFGEMALVTGAPRSAAVLATTDARLWALRKVDFDRVAGEQPEIAAEITRVLGERLSRGNARSFHNEAFTLLALTPERPDISIGRAPGNDLVIDDPQVAAVHARVVRSDGRWTIEDLGTTIGTYVNRRRVIDSAVLQDGDEVLIGTNKLFLDGASVRGFSGDAGLGIEVVDLTKTLADGRRILDEVSLCILPCEFVALVGSSGAGKTSLLHALNAFSPATSGSVGYDGIDLYSNLDLFRPALGYVPQDDVVHNELTVERTLYYAARLRLPPDTGADEIRSRIDDVLEAVGLSQRRDVQVRRLSGGQRKRVSVALELLARPRTLYLDEPTSGLDPALEARLMTLFRDVSASGATVIISTHATQNLRLCDKVAWMAPGGRLVFFGSPAEALRHFGVQDFSEVYALLETPEAIDRWTAAFRDSPSYRVNVLERLEQRQASGAPPAETVAAPAARPPLPRRAGAARQLFWLTARYAEVMGRDALSLALLLAQAPFIGAATLLLFSGRIFAATSEQGGDAVRALMALHVITASAIFLGASNAAREITKESAVYRRERLVNLGVIPYVTSKVAVLALLCLLQSAVLVGIFAAGVDLPGSGWRLYPVLAAAVFLTELAGLSMGLLVSALSPNSDRAMAAVPVLLIPQLIFAGALVPLYRMTLPARIVSQFMISKWALQLTGMLTHLDQRFTAQLPAAFAGPYAREMTGAAWLPWLVLALFAVAMLAAATLVQKRKDVV